MPALVLLATLVSGTAALAAEVAWFRGLGRGVGTSAEALAVVTAAFLGGLGVGAGVAGRLAARAYRPFRAAALCEAAAAVLVFATPWAVAAIPSLHLAVLDALGLEPGPSAWPAALVALPVLLLPCAFLGATLPFLLRGLLASVRRAGRWTGALYGVNTLGAAAGVVLAVFVLLPLVGETASLRAAAAGNALAALLILFAERPVPAPPPAEPPEATEPALAPGAASRADLALFASGALALAAEVAWFRLLEPLTDISAIGLAFLLVPILLGTALGGLVGGRIADRVRRPDLALATAMAVGGLLTVLSLPGSGLVPLASMAWAKGPEDLLAWKVAASAPCVLVPLAAFAAAYPLAVRARAASTSGAVRASGAVYAWNTAGNVVGSLAAGFAVLPALGAPRALVLLGATGLALGAGLWLSAARPRRPAWALAFVLPVAVLAWPGVIRSLQGSGPSLPEVVALDRWRVEHGRVRSADDLRAYAELVGGEYPAPARDPDGAPILPREGRVGTVGLLREFSGVVRVRQGGLSESMFQADDPDAGSETEVALALVPWLLHPDPRSALVIGHGAGWTVEALLATGMPEVHVAELEPAVLDVVERYRGRLPVRRAPNARLHVADGRLLLRRAAARGGEFDLVVSQPSHPWVPGAGHLFTAEAYRLARSSLRPGGVFAQWLNLFNMDRELFRTAVASWLGAFPECWMLLYEDEVVLVGFTSPARILPERWERALGEGSEVGNRARAAGIVGPHGLLRRLAADGAGLSRLVGPGAVSATDDDPRLELGLARGRMALRSDLRPVYSDVRGAFPPDLAAALPDSSVRGRWVTQVIRAALDGHRLQEAKAWAEKVPVPVDAEGKRVRARLAREDGDLRRAEELLRAAMAEGKDDGDTKADLVDVLIEAGPAEAAVEAAERFAGEHRDHGRVLESLARALLAADRLADAEAAFVRALAARSPRPPKDTAPELARLRVTLEPPKRWEAMEALLVDPRALESRDALERLIGLEVEFVEAGKVSSETLEEHEARLEAAKAAHGENQVLLARRDLLRDPKRALRAASAATDAIPRSSEAWRLRGWLELRDGLVDRAVSSLRTAVEVAAPAERDAERARAEAYLRMASVDPARLAEEGEPLP